MNKLLSQSAIFIAGLLFTASLHAQIGPLPGMAVLPPPKASGGGCGTPAVTNVGTNENGSGNATVTLTGATVPAASLIIVVVVENTTTAVLGTVGDTVNTYSSITPIHATGVTIGIFYAPNASLSGGTITYTKNASTHVAAVSAVYSSNIATSSPLDSAVTATATGASAAPTVTSGSPAQSGELFIGALGWSNGTATFTQDSGNGWSSPPNSVVTASAPSVAGGNQVNSGTGTKAYAPSLSTAVVWADLVVGFKHC